MKKYSLNKRIHIAKKPCSTKLFLKDKNFIEKMIEEKKKENENFENYSSAIRYYVHIGIDAENDGDKLTHTFKDRVVFRAFGSMFTGMLKPLLNKIGVVQSLLENLIAQNKTDFSYNQSQFIKITDRIKADVEEVQGSDQSGNPSNPKMDQYILRNLLTMRIFTYLMILGIKADPFPDRLWIDAITITDENLAKISMERFAAMNPIQFDREVKILAEAIFIDLKKKRKLQAGLEENIINPYL